MPVVPHSAIINKGLVWHYTCPRFLTQSVHIIPTLEEMNHYYHLPKAFEKLYVLLGNPAAYNVKLLKEINFYYQERLWKAQGLFKGFETLTALELTETLERTRLV